MYLLVFLFGLLAACNGQNFPAKGVCPQSNMYLAVKGISNQFVECKNYQQEYKTCPEGQIFNIKVQYTENPCINDPAYVPLTNEASRPKRGLCPQSNTYVIVEGKNNEFVECKNYEPEYKMCPEGEIFNVNAKFSEYPCMDNPGYLVPSKEKSLPAKSLCPQNNTYVGLEEKPNEFIECKNFQAEYKMCPEGQLFDIHAKYPGYPCIESPVVSVPSKVPSHTPTGLCPQNNTYVAVEDKNDTYIECKNFHAEYKTCPEGQLFNVKAKYSENPCIDNQAKVIPSIEKKVAAVSLCPENNTYVAMDSKNNTYIECKNFKGEYKTCPEGLIFNVHAKYLEEPCFNDTTYQMTNKERRAAITVCPESNTYLSVEGNDNKYIECKNYHAEYKYCPKGEVFDVKAKYPASPCVTEIPKSGVCARSHTYLPVEGKKNQFIECKNYVPEYKTCPADLIFNSSVQYPSCPCTIDTEHLLPLRGLCPQNNTYVTVEGKKNQFIECKNYQHHYKSCPEGEIFNVNAIYPAYPCIEDPAYKIPSSVCPQSYTYVMVAGKNNQFIECKNYQHEYKTCPEGQLFNVSAQYPGYPCIDDPAYKIPRVCPQNYTYVLVEGKKNQFIECKNYQHEYKTCPEGELFNVNAVYPAYPCIKDPAYNILRVCPQSYTYVMVEGKNNQFIECKNYQHEYKTCPEGELFNVNAIYPAYPCIEDPAYKIPKVCPQSNTYIAVEGKKNQFIECKNYQHEYKTCPEGQLFNVNAVYPAYPCIDDPAYIIPAPKICPQSYTYVAVEGKKHQFIECKNYQHEYKTCPEGQLFNVNAVYPAYPCIDDPAYIIPAPKICPQSNTYVAVEGKKHQFIECKNYQHEYKTCPEGQLFNINAVYPAYPCIDDPAHIIPAPKICPQSYTYVAVEGKKHQFIECKNYQHEYKTCPEGQLFNVNAVYPAYPCIDDPAYNIPRLCPQSYTYILVEGRKNQYIECKNYQHEYKTCPEGKLFNVNALYPEYPCIDDPAYIIPGRGVCPRNYTYVAVEGKKHQYIECTNYQPDYRTCPGDHIFNVNAQYPSCPCMEDPALRIPEKKICLQSNTYLAVDGKKNQFIECKNYQHEYKTCPEGQLFNVNANYPGYPCIDDPAYNIPRVCPQSYTYLLVEGKKNQFIECKNYQHEYKTCPEGQLFNVNASYPTYPCIDDPAYNIPRVCPQSYTYLLVEGKKNQYIECKNYQHEYKTCPEGQLFNVNSLYPAYPCIDDPAYNIPRICPQSYTYLLVEGKKNQFIECKNYQHEYKTCPEGQLFNVNSLYPAYPCIDDPAYNIPRICPQSYTYLLVEGKKNQFIECKNYQHEYKTCPEGQLFNVNASYPTYPCIDDPAYNIPRVCHQSYTYLLVEGKKNQYIECKNYQHEYKTCPEGQLFNLNASYPTYPCIDDPAYNIPRVCPQSYTYLLVEGKKNQFIECKNYQHEYKTCPEGELYNVNAVYPGYPCIEDPAYSIPEKRVCPQSNTYLAIEGKWNQFIECKNYQHEYRTCQEGQLFNVNARYPEYPCINDPAYIIPSAECPQSNTYVAVQGKKNQFIECKNYQAEYKTCKEGQLFNVNAQYPSYPCINDPAYTIPTIVNGVSEHGVTCPKAYTWMDTGSCDTYIACENYKPFRRFCPDGLNYNPELKWPQYPCDYPSEAPCRGRAYSRVPGVSQPSGDCPRQNGRFPYPNAGPGDCGKFIVCVAGRAITMHCPVGLAFNEVNTTCDYIQNVATCRTEPYLNIQCPPGEVDADGNGVVTNFRYGSDCHYFYSCLNGEGRVLSCDPGFSFNAKTSRCEESESVDCRDYGNASELPARYRPL